MVLSKVESNPGLKLSPLGGFVVFVFLGLRRSIMGHELSLGGAAPSYNSNKESQSSIEVRHNNTTCEPLVKTG